MELSELTDLVGDGKIFSAEFIKRTDGTVRKMVARTGVKPEGGGQESYRPEQHNLLRVWDMQARGYRAIPADNVLKVKAHGRVTITELATRRLPR